MDQIPTEIDISRNYIHDGLEQRGNISSTLSDEAATIDPAAAPDTNKPVTTTHWCEHCGHPVASGKRGEERRIKLTRGLRRKEPSIVQQEALLDTDSDDKMPNSPVSSSSYASLISDRSNSDFEGLSASKKLDFASGSLKRGRVDVLYKVKCSEKGKLDKIFYSDTQFSGLEVHKANYDQASVIEIISTVKGKSLSETLKGQSRRQFQRTSQGKGIQFGKNFMVSEIRKPSIIVHSEALQEALRHVVRYYPSQTMTGRKLTFQPPYEPLFHYYEKFKAYKYSLENGYEIQASPSPVNSPPVGVIAGISSGSASIPLAPTGSSTPLQSTEPHRKVLSLEENTAYDIGVLVDYLTPQYEDTIKPEKALYARGLASYKMLWLLFEPGIEVYGIMDGQHAAHVVTQVENGQGGWLVEVWSLASAGEKITRQAHVYEIKEFGGEREITSLDVFPCFYLDREDKGKTRFHLEQRGQRYYEILRELPMHMTYSGLTLDQTPTTYYGQIILDPRSYLKHFIPQPNVVYPRRGQPPPPPPGAFDTKLRPTSHFACNSHAENDRDRGKPVDFGGEIWKNYDNIDAKDPTILTLTPHHYRMFPRYFLGFSLKGKSWMIFDVDKMSPVIWPPVADDAMKYLVLPKRDKEIVQALSKKFDKWKKATWSADFIEDKGAGQVFLLHGPPGTGKTYTVECVAKYARRPLLPLTVADIGTSESSIQGKLEKWFYLAEHWGAILLIDEADVFLESRTTASLQRNSLVSVFLRTMEYYTGMLFLTTNRMGQIDDAFLSRIQVALGYLKLSHDAQMSIWEGFFEKLEEERRDLVISQRAKTFVLTDEKFKQMGWNGREIRNALHTAIALATHDVYKGITGGKDAEVDEFIEIKEKHFEQLRERREVFVTYRNSIDKRTEEQRAAAAKDRARLE